MGNPNKWEIMSALWLGAFGRETMGRPESEFIAVALDAAREVIGSPLSIVEGASLLYQVTVDNRLAINVNPKKPTRGNSAFQTDVCIFEEVSADVTIPRVVLEFKANLSTHDVLTYSAKARRHKQVYPYLRYGLVIGNETTIPGRFFTHNEALDFCVAGGSFKKNRLQELFARLLGQEVKASRALEQIAFGHAPVFMFRSDIIADTGDGRVV